MNERTLNSATSKSLAELASIPASEAVTWFSSLLAQVAALHQSGRLHGAIVAGGVTLGMDRRPVLSKPPDRVLLGGANAGDCCPPEMPAGWSWDMPTDLAAARTLLANAGVSMDPRRIDVYQLGVLLGFLVTDQTGTGYGRSQKARAAAPSELRPVIERALGHNARIRLNDCAQFAKLLIEAASTGQTARGTTPGISPPERVAAAANSLPPGLKETAAFSQPVAPAPITPLNRLGSYQILGRIGGGGMGDVYKAQDAALDRIVAIKVLPSDLTRQPEFVRRFRAEAMAIAKLTHPNIVQVFAFGEEAGRHFFAMQYVDGESLAQRLRRQGPLPLDQALPIFEQCLAALATAHARGLIHRDIKPGNLLIDRQGRALLADFGLVKTLDGADHRTTTGVIMGTADYLSPEQARGQHVDGRSDLYSLGVLMFQTLSDQLPFVSESATGLIFQHALEPPIALAEVAPDVPEPIAAIVMRLLAKDPSDRYQTAEEVLADIQNFRAGKLAGSLTTADDWAAQASASRSGRLAARNISASEPGSSVASAVVREPRRSPGAARKASPKGVGSRIKSLTTRLAEDGQAWGLAAVGATILGLVCVILFIALRGHAPVAAPTLPKPKVASAPPARPAPATITLADRTAADRVWINESYNVIFYPLGNGRWAERDRNTGKVNHDQYQQTAQTDEYLECFCNERHYAVRVRPTRMEQKINGKFQWTAHGHWESATAQQPYQGIKSSPASNQPAQKLPMQWSNDSYGSVLRWTDGDNWTEYDNKTGKLRLTYTQEGRNKDYLELFCPSRNQHLRFYANRAELLKNGRWEWVSNGKWIDSR